ncbi:YeeE/YedE family protein [Ideonella sp.]|uniref:YeeE/YedE family protein n=1 Tax=Ideonella sp. TaxID=1929293 RepID=UPI003BB7500A
MPPDLQPEALAALTRWVLWSGFGLAMALGALARWSHFCTMGAVADVFHMGDWTRARMWILSVGTAAIGFGLLAGIGQIDPARALYTSPRLLWLSTAVGGLMFGVGMVLASGCGNKTLVRIGGGNLKSLVVFLVMAFAALATLRGITAVLRNATVDQAVWMLPVGQDLPALFTRDGGAARRTLALVLGLGVGGSLWVWVLSRREARQALVIGAGAGVGLLVVAMWWVTGSLGFVAEHPETLEAAYLGTANGTAMEAFSFVSPMAATVDWLILFSDRNKLVTLGVLTPLGVVLGSALVAWRMGEFRWEGFSGAEDTANHLVGALLMGVGGVTALGCTVGQGLSGLSTLSLGSAIATAGFVAGAWAALHYQSWRIERQG